MSVNGDDLGTVLNLLMTGTCNSLNADDRKLWKDARDEMVAKLEIEVGVS